MQTAFYILTVDTPDNIFNKEVRSALVYLTFPIIMKSVKVSGVLCVNSGCQQAHVLQVLFLQQQEFIIFLLFIHLRCCAGWFLLIVRSINI